MFWQSEAGPAGMSVSAKAAPFGGVDVTQWVGPEDLGAAQDDEYVWKADIEKDGDFVWKGDDQGDDDYSTGADDEGGEGGGSKAEEWEEERKREDERMREEEENVLSKVGAPPRFDGQ